MAPAADEQKVSLDARGVLIMLVALGGIVGLWVNEFMVSEDNYPAGYVYQPPKRGKAAEPAVREPPRPVLLTVEDCGKLALEAVREYVERHPIERDDSAEITREETEDKAASEEEPAVLDDFRSRAKARDEDTRAAASSEEVHDEEPPKKHVVESEEEADEEEGVSAGQETEEEESAEAEIHASVQEESEEQQKVEKTRTGPRSRKHIAEVLGFAEIGTKEDKEEEALIESILKELKKLSVNDIEPMEKLYKFKDISTRLLGDAEIFNKPMALFLGPWSAGKSSIINYLLGTEHTKAGLKTGPQPSDIDFTIVHYADKLQRLSGTEMAAHWAFSSVQKFGQGFLDHFKGIGLPHPLLQKVTIVDTPGILDKRKIENYPFNDAFQWFIDRADAIYVVFDPSKLEIGEEMATLLDQLKGREGQIRFILNKADFIQPHDIMRVTGQLLWNISPLLGSSDAPIIHVVSMTSRPFHAGTPAEFFEEQELTLLEHLREIMDERVENTIAFARRHAVRVRNHAKLVDCYLSTFYKQKGLFGSKKKVAEQIAKDPNKYHIFEGLSRLTNISRYDLPDPQLYYKFFKLNPMYDFKPLTATCTYFKGCPLDKLDIAIAYDLPQLLGKYNDQTKLKKDHDKSMAGHAPVPLPTGQRHS
ncbi:hypothetical protein HPB52_006067 [Rhipicephalus sanguineus]|uniref:Dynamin-type G domain-containing protein n=1 Tax=Rhipicephalus sanguineus TaxID=34632 RepID=A0A9D4Q4W5_RHISA|nr:hypothetical protein HPB52_006067 [Rhipicephalus sanguineus]